MTVKRQRQHIRLETRQLARVRLPGSPLLRCEVRDFCQSGLFLRVLEGLPQVLTAASVGLEAIVELDAADADARSHRVSGRVAHISAGGIGLQTDVLANGVLRSLLDARQHALPIIRLLPSGLTAQEASDVQQECIGRYRQFLHQTMQGFFAAVEQKLVEGSATYLSIAEESRFLNGLLALKVAKTEVNDGFLAYILDRVQHLGEGANDGGPTRELTLVDDESFADWLGLAAVIGQIEGEIFAPLGAFEQRYSQVVTLPIGKLNDPFGPNVVCHALQEAMRNLDLDTTSRGLIYRLFASVVLPLYPPFYDELNALLAPLKPVVAHPAGQLRAITSAIEPEEDKDATILTLSRLAETLLAASDPDETGRTAAGASARRLRPAEVRDEPSLAAAVPDEAARAADPVMTANALQQTLRQLSSYGVSNRRRAEDVASLADGARLAEATLSEILATLDALLREEGDKRREQGAPPLAEALTDRLQQIAGAERTLARTHQAALGTVGGVFEEVRTQYSAGSDLDNLMQRLEGPIVKLALKDPMFLQSDAHPARRMLELLDKFGFAADDAGRFFDRDLAKSLETLVDRVVATEEADASVYDTACTTLEKMLFHLQRVRRQRIAAYQEVCEGQERIRQARANVARRLEDLLGGRSVHRLLPSLIEIGWRQYLVLLDLRQGTGGADLNQAIATLEQLVGWLGIPGGMPPADSDTIRVTLKQVGDTLAEVNTDRQQQVQFMSELESLLFAAGSLPIPAKDMVQVVVGRYARAVDSRDPVAVELNGLAGRLRVGDWWELRDGEVPMAMQLIWIAPRAKSCAFVNLSATRKLELTGEELARQCHTGSARLSENRELPLLERSLNSRVDSLYQHLVHHSLHDPVSNLLNRKGLLLRLDRPATGPAWERPQVVAVLELDQYQVISRSCGTEGGDSLLRSVADRIQPHLLRGETLAVLREGAFAVHLPDCTPADAQQRMTALLGSLRDYRFDHQGSRYSIGISIGLADCVAGVVGGAEALRRADAACQAARSSGRSPVQCYEAADSSLAQQEAFLDWAGRIDGLLARDGLYLRCQMVKPIGDTSPLLPYYEILLGIDDANGNSIGPQEFIEAVEHWKRSQDIDLWVIDNVFRWIRSNRDIFAATGGFSINLSASSLASSEVLARLEAELSTGDLPGSKIIFEITETATIGSYAAAQDFIQQLRRYGCKFCIDDFGSGNATYAYLKNLRTDTLKIDGSFVKDMVDSPMDFALVKSMNEIAHSLGMHTVAEYVATDALHKLLEEIGVDYAQGYAVHKPTRLDALRDAAPSDPHPSGSGRIKA